jgi:hypothetical protein
MKWGSLGVAALVASTALAADHGDGSASGVGAWPLGDINDVYSWMSSDQNRLIMIMSVGGLSAGTSFDPNVQYVFHVNRSTEPLAAPGTGADTNVICTFDASQNISCWVGNVDYVTGDASATAGILSSSNLVKVHAAQHADPFHFYLDGFDTTRATVLSVAGSLTFENSGCPIIGGPTVTTLQQQLNGTDGAGGSGGSGGGASGGAIDNFASNNVLAISLEIDKTLFGGSGDYFAVWASTRDAS